MATTRRKPAKKPAEPKTPRVVTSRETWIAIEAEYRAGIRSNRQIAETHGVSEAAIRKRADQEGWEQNLADRVRLKAEEKIARHIAAQAEDVVDANANALVSVELTQRQDIKNLRELVSLLTTECMAQCRNPELFQQLGELMASPDETGKQDKLNELYFKVIAVPGRISSVKQLADTLKTLIELERKILKMDIDPSKNGAGVEDLLRKIGRGK